MPELKRIRRETASLPLIVGTGAQVGIVAIAIANDAQNGVARGLLKASKKWRRELKNDPELLKLREAADAAVQVCRDYVSAHEEAAKQVEGLLEGGIVGYADAVALAARKKAEADARTERERLARVREEEAAELERAAKRRGTKRVDKRALTDEAASLRDAPLPDAKAAGQRAAAQAVSGLGGKGRGSIVKGWDVFVDNLGHLAAAVVGSNLELFTIAGQVSAEGLAPVPLEALNAKRVGGELVTSPWLTTQAKDRGGDLRIRGVIVTEKSGSVRST